MHRWAGGERASPKLGKTAARCVHPTTHFTERGLSVPEEGPPSQATLRSDSTSSALALTKRPLAPLTLGVPWPVTVKRTLVTGDPGPSPHGGHLTPPTAAPP